MWRWLQGLVQGWRERAQRKHSNDAAVAMAVYLTYTSGQGPLPSVRLQRWCNKQLRQRVFDERGD